MKNRFLIVLLLSISSSAISQSSLSAAAAEGTWQVIAVDIPTMFAYNKESQTFTPYANIKNALANDASGVTKNSVEDIKHILTSELGKNYLDINNDKTFVFVINGVKKSGSYNFPVTAVPRFNSDEESFIQFAQSWGYNGVLQLIPIPTSNPVIWANAKIISSGTTLFIKNLKINLGEIPFPCTYTLKKASKAEADALKENIKKAEENKVKIEKEKVEVKQKADEDKNGKVYTAADKEPSFNNEKVAWAKIVEQLYYTAPEYAAPPGKYVVTVQYIVNTNGSISDITVPTDPSFGLKNKVIELVKRLPVMTPAEINGQKVRFKVTKEFKFTITGDE